MRSLKMLWSATRDSLWFLPAVFTAGAAVLAASVLAFERGGAAWSGDPPWWLYQGGVDGARTVLNVITGSLITVTGVVFSVTIVAVQLASSQYTPRVMRNFSADRGNQVVLGIFIGTFTYAVLVLRSVRDSAGGEEVVPRLAVTFAVGLVIVSVMALIYFINHMAREMHVTVILDRVTRQTMGNVHQLFPEHLGHADDDPPPDPRDPGRGAVAVPAVRAGYVQAVNADRLFELGERGRMEIGMGPKIGEFVLQGRTLAWVRRDGGDVSDELADAIRRAFVLGIERTPDQDVEFGILQMADVAIKALSPGINDPTTAIRCIDRLAEILAEFGTRRPPEPRRTRDGAIRFVASYTTFERAVEVAYGDLRNFGAPIPLIAMHLLETIGELLKLVPPARREPLVTQARAVLQSASASIGNTHDRAMVERVAERVARECGVELRTAE